MAGVSGCSVVLVLSWDDGLGLSGCTVSSLHGILQILIVPEENGCLDFVGAQDTPWAGCLQCFLKC